MLKFLFLFSFFSVIFAFRYDNYTLYNVLPKTEQQLKVLQLLEGSDKRFDFWSDPISWTEPVAVLSSPSDRSYFEGLLKSNAIDFDITFGNIQEIIDKQKSQVKSYTRGSPRNFALDTYHDLDEIYNWLDDLVVAYPTIITPLTIGQSYENRDLKGIKISHGEGKRAIFFEAGIHSREWISPATVVYMINELLTSDDELTRAAAQEFDWYIFPVTNPDGYVWTFTELRLWRKSRRPFGEEFGVDLNRNWDNNWMVIGASDDPSSYTYAGPSPFSEPETQALSAYLRTIADTIDMYVSFHNAGQLLLIPYGNTTDPLANYYDSMNIGRRAMGALSVRYGTEYTTGNIAEAIYHCSGTSIDWVKEELQIPLVYTYELRDRGPYRFLLPPEQIVPTGQETWDSILELIHQGRRFGYFNSSVNAGADGGAGADSGSDGGNNGVNIQGSMLMMLFFVGLRFFY